MCCQEAARSELFDNSARIKAIQEERRRPKATDIGLELPEEDRREIQAHTDEQDEYLDRVGQAVSTLVRVRAIKRMSGDFLDK